MVIQPDILLMDEPLGALDRQLRKEVQFEIRRLHAARPRTTIYVTHDQEEALVMSDRIAVMRAGRIVQIGSGARALRAAGRHVRRALSGRIEPARGHGASAFADGRATLAVPGLAQPLEGRAAARACAPACPRSALLRPEAIRAHGRRLAGARGRARLSWRAASPCGSRSRAATSCGLAVSPANGAGATSLKSAGMRARSRFCRMRRRVMNRRKSC